MTILKFHSDLEINCSVCNYLLNQVWISFSLLMKVDGEGKCKWLDMRWLRQHLHNVNGLDHKRIQDWETLVF